MNDQQKKRFAQALSRLANDCELLTTMASLVNEDGPAIWKELKMHVAEGDLLATVSAAHKLKGMLSTFETNSPVSELQEVTSAARDGKIEEVRAKLDDCSASIDDLFHEIALLEESVRS